MHFNWIGSAARRYQRLFEAGKAGALFSTTAAPLPYLRHTLQVILAFLGLMLMESI